MIVPRSIPARSVCFVLCSLAAVPALGQETPPPEPAADATPAATEAQAADETPRGLRLSEPGAFEGYTLFSPLLSRTTYLVGMDGEVVHTWESDLPPGCSAYLLENGHLLRGAQLEDNPVFFGGGIAGRIQELDWEGNVVWEYTLSNEDQMYHHDIEPMPNGNLLLIAWEYRYREDAIEFGRDADQVGEKGLWPDAVLEIKPTRPEGGEIVWEWHVWDHLIQDRDPAKPNYGSIAEHPELIDINADHRDEAPMSAEELERQAELEAELAALGYSGGDAGVEVEEEDPAKPADVQQGHGPDWLHTNAIDYNPEHDLIALSTPQMCEVWIIDHSTTSAQAAGHRGGRRGKGGDLLYRGGNPKNYAAGTAADQALFYQHDARWIPPGLPGAGNLTVFNNGAGRDGGEGYSSVDELVLPFDPALGFEREGPRFGPEKPSWSYSAPDSFFSSFISGAHRLANGNTFVCSGVDGRLFEVTPAGKVVWEYLNPFGGEVQPSFGKAAGGNAAPTGVPPKALFRGTRIAKDHPGLRGREL